MNVELFELGEGWGYRVDGVYQEYDPEREGFVPMNKARAEEMAQAVYARLNESANPAIGE